MILYNKRIFIVEDNLENRVIMSLLLEREGAKIAFERWGRETVEKLLRAAPVDLIVLDLMFPNEVSGFDIYDNIRAQPQFAQVPIVAVSAQDASIALPKARAKGFSGFIAKPVDFDLFATQIADLIANRQIWHTHNQSSGSTRVK